MKKNDVTKLIEWFGMPLLMMGLGLVLMFNPDSASALLSRIVGWVLVACAAISALLALTSPIRPQGSRYLLAGCLAVVGFLLISRPMSLAVVLGWVAGLMLLLRFVPQCLNARKAGVNLPVLPVALSVLGVLLMILPLTASRVIFNVGGLVLFAAGVALLLDALRGRKSLEEPDDPNIIDADE